MTPASFGPERAPGRVWGARDPPGGGSMSPRVVGTARSGFSCPSCHNKVIALTLSQRPHSEVDTALAPPVYTLCRLVCVQLIVTVWCGVRSLGSFTAES